MTVVGTAGVAMLIALVANPTASESRSKEPPTPEASVRAIEGIVKSLFRNWKEGEGKRNAEFFVDSEAPVVRSFFDRRVDRHTQVRRRAASAVLAEWQESPPKHLVLDNSEIDLLTDSLAVAKASGRGSGVKIRAIITLQRDVEQWKVVSLVIENRFNW